VIGRRNILILGTTLLSAFTLGCGLCRTYEELVVFRGFQGVAISFGLPSGVGIVANAFGPGQTRNIAFAALGGGQPIGYALGLVLGGFFVESIGWRYGFHLGTVCGVVFTAVAVWSLPADEHERFGNVWRKLQVEIDWIGAFIASSSLAMLFYVFALACPFLKLLEEALIVI